MSWPELFARLYRSIPIVILVWLPLYIGIESLNSVSADRSRFGLAFILLLSGCVAAAYLLLFIAYRILAYGKQQGKSNNRLFWPSFLTGLSAIFACMGATFTVTSLLTAKPGAIVGSVSILLTALWAWRRARHHANEA